MSLAITHFAIGAVITGLLVTLLRSNGRFSYTITILGGVWAILPDVHWVAPLYNEELRAFHDSWYAQLFWLHRTMDTVDNESKVVAGMAILLLLSVAVLQDWLRDRTIRSVFGQSVRTTNPISSESDSNSKMKSVDYSASYNLTDAIGGRFDRRKLLVGICSVILGAAVFLLTRGRSGPSNGPQAEVTNTSQPEPVPTTIDTPTDLGEKQGILWKPAVEYELRSTSWTGNPFDVLAVVTYRHEDTGASITSELHYVGENVWKLRFTGKRPGWWTFKTWSRVPELDGRTGRIFVESDNRASSSGTS